MNRALPYFVFFLFCILFLSFQFGGCIKEYSFEGADTTIAPVIADTTITDTTINKPDTNAVAIVFPQCNVCMPGDAASPDAWSFRTGSSYLCGTTTNAGFIGDGKTTITFFGPSACSSDTGIVMTIYLPQPLDQDRYHLVTSEAAFFYYDDTAANDILISQPGKPFNVTIDTFLLATQLVSGSFSGTAFTPANDSSYIKSGKFKVTLK